MQLQNESYDSYCSETEEIEKLYSDQAMLTYALMVTSIFIFSLLIVLVP